MPKTKYENSSKREDRIASVNERTKRRSQRFRKSVEFYGDIECVTSYTSNSKKCKQLMKNKLKQTIADSSQISVSIGKFHKHQETQDVQTAENLMQELKTKGVLPVLRCVNKKTGEHQIGIPKHKKTFKATRNYRKSISVKCMNSEKIGMLINHLSSQMFQEQVIFEDLVLSVPNDPNLTSLSAANEFCDKMMKNINNNYPGNFNVQHMKNVFNDDSKYHWL